MAGEIKYFKNFTGLKYFSEQKFHENLHHYHYRRNRRRIRRRNRINLRRDHRRYCHYRHRNRCRNHRRNRRRSR